VCHLKHIRQRRKNFAQRGDLAMRNATLAAMTGEPALRKDKRGALGDTEIRAPIADHDRAGARCDGAFARARLAMTARASVRRVETPSVALDGLKRAGDHAAADLHALERAVDNVIVTIGDDRNFGRRPRADVYDVPQIGVDGYFFDQGVQALGCRTHEISLPPHALGRTDFAFFPRMLDLQPFGTGERRED
jgi:hypothetical protein